MSLLNFFRFDNKHFLVLLGNGMLSLVGFALAALLFHSLPMADVGIWFFVQSIIAFCEAGRYGFLSTATVKFYAGTDPERARTVLGSVWFLAILLTGIVVAVNLSLMAFIPHEHNDELALCIRWVGITFIATLPSDVISWRLQADERYNTLLWFRILNSGCSVISFTALVLMDKMTLENAFLFNFLTNFVTSLVGILFNLAGIRTLVHRTKECIWELVHYGKFTLGTTSGSILLGNADTWIINFMLGPASVAIYNLSMRLMALIEMPLRSFAVTGMSSMAIAYNSDNLPMVTHIFKKYSGMLTIVFIPMAVAAFLLGDVAIGLLGGPDYINTEAANVYKLAMFISIIYPIERLNGITLDIIHMTKINFYKVIIMVALKIAGDFAGLAFFNNVYGIVFSILIVHLTALIFGNYQLQKHLNYSIPGILSTGYTEMKALVQKTFKA